MSNPQCSAPEYRREHAQTWRWRGRKSLGILERKITDFLSKEVTSFNPRLFTNVTVSILTHSKMNLQFLFLHGGSLCEPDGRH